MVRLPALQRTASLNPRIGDHLLRSVVPAEVPGSLDQGDLVHPSRASDEGAMLPAVRECRVLLTEDYLS